MLLELQLNYNSPASPGMGTIMNSAQVNKEKQLRAACAKPWFDGKNYEAH
jgi:hypothetical protein